MLIVCSHSLPFSSRIVSTHTQNNIIVSTSRINVALLPMIIRYERVSVKDRLRLIKVYCHTRKYVSYVLTLEKALLLVTGEVKKTYYTAISFVAYQIVAFSVSFFVYFYVYKHLFELWWTFDVTKMRRDSEKWFQQFLIFYVVHWISYSIGWIFITIYSIL